MTSHNRARGKACDRPPAGDRGFTLIELLVVLVILGLVLGMVIQRGPSRSPGLEARAAAGQVAQALRLARSRAIVGNRPVRFVLDVEEHSYALDGDRVTRLPGSLALSITARGTALGRLGVIGFAPDGSSTGGSIGLAGGSVRVAVGVDWLTGRVTVRNDL